MADASAAGSNRRSDRQESSQNLFSSMISEQTSMLPETPASMANTLAESEHLFSACEEYLGADDIMHIAKSLEFGATAHAEQTRASGEPYIAHPIAVATILADMRLDAASITAAILHDVIEDTDISKAEIANEFGEDVAELVEGVTKLDKARFDSKQEAQAASFQKMLLAMTRDIRVIIVKLADRLHNIRTIEHLKPASRRRIAHETLEIYAPIAQRLGMNDVRHELQDLGLKAFRPRRYEVIEAKIAEARDKRKVHVDRMLERFYDTLTAEGIAAELMSREKTVYSTYFKMRDQLREGATGERHDLFKSLNDIFGFRIVVESVDDCYRALGIVHSLYSPTPGRFKDYIAIPKVNGYQSLHTAIKGPTGLPMEVQIRTQAMHQLAEHGIAAHWRYKLGNADDAEDFMPQTRTQEWLRGLVDMQQETGSSMEFFESVKTDLFPDEVYVFTPKGDIKRLPRGATVVDYAYSLHTEIGHRCIGAEADGKRMLLRSEVLNGQTIEIKTQQGSRPDPYWLNFVVTARARTKIRDYLKTMSDEEAHRLGQHLFVRALSAFSISFEQVTEERISNLLQELNMQDMHGLLRAIGSGERMAPLVAKRIAQDWGQQRGDSSNRSSGSSHSSAASGNRSLLKRLGLRRSQEKPAPMIIRGTEGISVNLGNCCRPIMGDDVTGYLSQGKGMVVHRISCKNLKNYNKDPDHWVEVEWAKDLQRDFPAAIIVEVNDRRGVLADLSTTMTDFDANIQHLEIRDRDAGHARMEFVLDVHNRKHLADVMRRLRARPDVIKVIRPKG